MWSGEKAFSLPCPTRRFQCLQKKPKQRKKPSQQSPPKVGRMKPRIALQRGRPAKNAKGITERTEQPSSLPTFIDQVRCLFCEFCVSVANSADVRGRLSRYAGVIGYVSRWRSPRFSLATGANAQSARRVNPNHSCPPASERGDCKLAIGGDVFGTTCGPVALWS
ncbi:hypothetical protein RISK_003118 [Rhodopirellula islandica]|uniref:Uncharacterized protein n=1 Tax=Rhodopirellula islandica TaxID=595434 RepID=A0A0J1BE73_RHOIS|nr:hypothetical protein RISK_003118 [Rhodopirellula islandica]